MEVIAAWLESFFTSAAFTALASSVAGAFFGAYGAQRISDRDKFRQRLQKEIRDTNAATNISFGICNSLLALKGQHIKSLSETFHAHKAEFLLFIERRRRGEIPRDSEFHLLADFQSLTLPPIPLSLLQTQVFEKLSVVGRPLNLAITLGQTIHAIGHLCEKRNAIIETFKAGQRQLTPALYFGLPAQGIVNEDYSSSIHGIASQTDDAIYFSQLLCADMVEHANSLAVQYEANFDDVAPVVSEPKFEDAGDLMPDADLYSDWHTKFIKKERPERKRTWRSYLRW
jgi:hypothetical protein